MWPFGYFSKERRKERKKTKEEMGTRVMVKQVETLNKVFASVVGQTTNRNGLKALRKIAETLKKTDCDWYNAKLLYIIEQINSEKALGVKANAGLAEGNASDKAKKEEHLNQLKETKITVLLLSNKTLQAEELIEVLNGYIKIGHYFEAGKILSLLNGAERDSKAQDVMCLAKDAGDIVAAKYAVSKMSRGLRQGYCKNVVGFIPWWLVSLFFWKYKKSEEQTVKTQLPKAKNDGKSTDAWWVTFCSFPGEGDDGQDVGEDGASTKVVGIKRDTKPSIEGSRIDPVARAAKVAAAKKQGGFMSSINSLKKKDDGEAP
jgi:hypothetical protein